MKTVVIWVESFVIFGFVVLVGLSPFPYSQTRIYKYLSTDHAPSCKKAPCPRNYQVEIHKDIRLLGAPQYKLMVSDPTMSYASDDEGYEIKFSEIDGADFTNEAALKPSKLNQTDKGVEITWSNGNRLFIPQKLY